MKATTSGAKIPISIEYRNDEMGHGHRRKGRSGEVGNQDQCSCVSLTLLSVEQCYAWEKDGLVTMTIPSSPITSRKTMDHVHATTEMLCRMHRRFQLHVWIELV